NAASHPPRLKSMRRCNTLDTGCPSFSAGLNFERDTACMAGASNTCPLELITCTLLTEPSGSTVKPTVTEPDRLLRAACSGYSGCATLTTWASRVSPAGFGAAGGALGVACAGAG